MIKGNPKNVEFLFADRVLYKSPLWKAFLRGQVPRGVGGGNGGQIVEAGEVGKEGRDGAITSGSRRMPPDAGGGLTGPVSSPLRFLSRRVFKQYRGWVRDRLHRVNKIFGDAERYRSPAAASTLGEQGGPGEKGVQAEKGRQKGQMGQKGQKGRTGQRKGSGSSSVLRDASSSPSSGNGDGGEGKSANAGKREGIDCARDFEEGHVPLDDDEWAACSKLLYHAYHKLHDLEPLVRGVPPSVAATGTQREEIMAVRSERGADLGALAREAWQRLAEAEAFECQTDHMHAEVDIDELVGWLVGVRRWQLEGDGEVDREGD